MKTKQKKGALDISFNWILILVVGTAITIFFIAIVSNQKEKSEINSALTVRSELNSIFSGASLSKDKQLEVDMPDINLKMVCEFATCEDFTFSNNPSCYSNYEIGDTGINQQTPSQIIFSPNSLSGRKLFTWTLPWNIPFYVTNFLYITGTNIKYIFIDEENTLSFFNEFPEKANKKLISPNQLSNEPPEGNEIFKIIFFNSPMQNIEISEEIISSAKPEDISAININTASKQIDFYYFEQGSFILSDSIRYLTDSEIYAAIFSDSIDFYKCNMQKAFNRLYAVSSVLQQRAQSLFENALIDSSCIILYNTEENGLNAMKENSNLFSNENINSLSIPISKLIAVGQSAKEKSCPLVY